jgi:hypothetical protein
MNYAKPKATVLGPAGQLIEAQNKTQPHVNDFGGMGVRDKDAAYDLDE